MLDSWPSHEVVGRFGSRGRLGDGVGLTRRRRDTLSTQVAKWVPRKNLSRKPKSAEAMELDKEEKAWQHQLYRARQAKERAEVRQALKDRQKEIERANELEERSGAISASRCVETPSLC